VLLEYVIIFAGEKSGLVTGVDADSLIVYETENEL